MPAKLSVLAALGLWLAGFAPVCVHGSSAVTHGGLSYSIDVWRPDEEKLTQSSVIALIQSRDGYLWLGTLNGLVRFDGIRFTVFDETNTPGLNSSRIMKLFEDSQRNLWIATETAGVALVLAKDGRVRTFDLGRGNQDAYVVSACEDSLGAVWLYTADGQLCRYRDGRADIWAFFSGASMSCRIVIAGESGRVLIGTDSRITVIGPTVGLDPQQLPEEKHYSVGRLDFLLASRGGAYWRLADNRIQRWKGDKLEQDLGPYPWNTNAVRVSSVCEDQQGHLVVGTRGAGLYWFDAAGKATHLSTVEGLSHNYILSLQVDLEGNLWIGTDGGGLNRIKRQVFASVGESRGWVVQSVCEDDQGGLWIGANSGGVGYWKNGAVRRFLADFPVRTVFVDSKQRVWAGTAGAGLFHFHNGNFQPVSGPAAFLHSVSAIYEDRAGKLWMGTQNGLVRRDEPDWKVLTTRDGLSKGAIRAIAEDNAGNLWIGTMGGGLNRWHNGHVQTFRKSDDGLPSDEIWSLYADAAGVLWVGTGSGLARLQGEKWTRFTTREGLVGNGVSYLLEDGERFLWIGSNLGLMRVPKQALNDFANDSTGIVPCRVYGKADGLPTRECTQGSQPGAFRGRDGALWFPTTEGLVSVKPSELKPNPFPPPVVIETVSLDGAVLGDASIRAGPPRSIRIPPRKERLEIHYTSLNLAAPERARFKYRLDGLESAWTEVGDARVARYSSLPPGRFRFQVTACNEDGVWNDTGSTLDLIVEPPIWRTWWFMTSAVVLLLGTVGGAVHYFSTQKLQRQLEKLKQQEAIEKERARIARDLHDQLGANLTQVSLLGEMVESDKDSPAEVESLGGQIARTARETTRALDEIVWAANPSNDTLEGLISYICKYAQEYLAVAGLRYRLEVPSHLPAAPIAPDVRHNVFLASKEAVTNVVRHAKATSAWLRLNIDRGCFTLEIADNGRGLTEADARKARNGLRNMRKRMEEIGGQFSIGPGAEGGAVVRLTAPIKPE
jgi:ligand-binding sensor domain-containing protein/signal transduction histidine kinase